MSPVLIISISAFLAICMLCIVIFRMAQISRESKTINKRLEFWLSEQSSTARGTDKKTHETHEENFAKRVLMPIGEEVGQWMADKVSFAQQSTIRKQLIAAGYRDKKALTIFYAIKMAVSGGLSIFIFLTMGVFGKDPANGLLLALTCFGAGFILPQVFLDSVASGRRSKIDKVLPDALDLLVICTEAGMGVDQSLLRVASNLGLPGKDLGEEIIITNREMNLGLDRGVCWDNLGERTGSEELKNLARVISQSEKVGASVGTVLRGQAEFMRVKRKQRAEEAAAQMSVKMMVPTVIFIFPCVLVVTFGPPLVKLMSTFSGSSF